MTRVMYDSATQWEKIPVTAEMVAGYVDGEYAWPAEAWARFPRAAHVHISVIPPGDAVRAGVLDVENGAATLADIPAFCRWHMDHGSYAVVYASLDNIPAVRQVLAGNQLKAGLWVASWTSSPHRLADMSAVVAVQYAGGPGLAFDISEVFDGDWHRVPRR
jgi:hypothetical protein